MPVLKRAIFQSTHHAEHRAMLTLQGLSAWYGQAQILYGVNLSMEKGRCLALLGRNGAGKTSLLKSIIGIGPQARGTLTFQGQDLRRLAPHRRARLGLGYVPEDRRLFADLTVAENLSVAAHDPDLSDLFTLFPALAPLRAQKAGTLSGGEQQMLTIARSLSTRPSLLLLDEPSEGLAPRIVADLRQALKALKAGGLSLLIAEQNLDFVADLADQAVILESGQVAADLAMADLLQTPALQQRHLGL